MNGRIVGLFLAAVALVGGVGMYWLQIHAFYEEVPASGPDDVRVTLADGRVVPLPHTGFRAIDSDSSPIRFRACFALAEGAQDRLARARPAPDPVPLVAPGWFACFDAEAIGAALAAGRAQAAMGEANIRYGIDRIVAVFADGRGVAWNQINRCGAAFFDGDPLPPGCPPAPTES